FLISLLLRRPPISTLFPYTTLFRSFGDIPSQLFKGADIYKSAVSNLGNTGITGTVNLRTYRPFDFDEGFTFAGAVEAQHGTETRSEEHTSELQSRENLVCRLLLEKK